MSFRLPQEMQNVPWNINCIPTINSYFHLKKRSTMKTLIFLIWWKTVQRGPWQSLTNCFKLSRLRFLIGQILKFKIIFNNNFRVWRLENSDGNIIMAGPIAHRIPSFAYVFQESTIPGIFGSRFFLILFLNFFRLSFYN